MLFATFPERGQHEHFSNNKTAATDIQHERPEELSLIINHYHHLLSPPEEMNTSRKFSYASVKEESGMFIISCPGEATCIDTIITGEGLPQSFESSLSTQDLEEVEW